MKGEGERKGERGRERGREREREEERGREGGGGKNIHVPITYFLLRDNDM